MAIWDHAPLGNREKVITPPEGEVFQIDQQPKYHFHGPYRCVEFLLAPAPMPSAAAPKRANLLIMDACL